MLTAWKESYDQPRQHLKCRDIALPTKVHIVKAMVFPVDIYGCESWTISKAECWKTDAFELWCWTRFESPLDCKEIKPVNSKGNQSWVFTGRTDAEAEAPILGPPDAKSWLIRKDPDAGKDWGQEEKGAIEDEMVGWHHWCNGHEFEQVPGDSEGQGSLACCSPWGCKEWDIGSVRFSLSVMSNSLWPHGLQYTRFPCPSLSPGTCSNLCSLGQWCHPTISSSVTPFSSCHQSFSHQGLFQRVSSSSQVAKVLELQLQHQSFQRIFRVDFL